MTERMKMKINSKDFRVPPEAEVKLSERPTTVKPLFKSKKHYHKRLCLAKIHPHWKTLNFLHQLCRVH